LNKEYRIEFSKVKKPEDEFNICQEPLGDLRDSVLCGRYGNSMDCAERVAELEDYFGEGKVEDFFYDSFLAKLEREEQIFNDQRAV
jgi:hypothetical protein